MAKTYNKLRGKIVEHFGNQKTFAENVGISEQSVTAKLNGKSDFSQSDIIKWCELLQIEANDIGNYFFDNQLSNG